MPMIGLIAAPYTAQISQEQLTHDATYPIGNALNNDYGRVVRSSASVVNSLYGAVYSFPAGAVPVDVIALLWHNLRSTDRIHVRAGDTVANAIAGTQYLSGALSPWTGTSKREISPLLWKFMLTLNTPINANYWYIAVQAITTVHPSGYLQYSRAFLGKKALFNIGAQKAILSAVDYNQRASLESGEERVTEDINLIRPSVGLQLEYAKESEMADVLGTYTLGLGTSKPLLVTPDAAGTYLQDTLAFGRPERIMSLESDTYDVWSFNCQVPSLGP